MDIYTSSINAKIGIFVGSFDPPHLGHDAVIAYVLREQLVDHVYICGNNPRRSKPDRLSYAIRREMIHLMWEHTPHVTIIDVPVQDWLPMFQSTVHPTCIVYGIIGSDIYMACCRKQQLPRMALEHWIVICRGVDHQSRALHVDEVEWRNNITMVVPSSSLSSSVAGTTEYECHTLPPNTSRNARHKRSTRYTLPHADPADADEYAWLAALEKIAISDSNEEEEDDDAVRALWKNHTLLFASECPMQHDRMSSSHVRQLVSSQPMLYVEWATALMPQGQVCAMSAHDLVAAAYDDTLLAHSKFTMSSYPITARVSEEMRQVYQYVTPLVAHYILHYALYICPTRIVNTLVRSWWFPNVHATEWKSCASAWPVTCHTGSSSKSATSKTATTRSHVPPRWVTSIVMSSVAQLHGHCGVVVKSWCSAVTTTTATDLVTNTMHSAALQRHDDDDADDNNNNTLDQNRPAPLPCCTVSVPSRNEGIFNWRHSMYVLSLLHRHFGAATAALTFPQPYMTFHSPRVQVIAYAKIDGFSMGAIWRYIHAPAINTDRDNTLTTSARCVDDECTQQHKGDGEREQLADLLPTTASYQRVLLHNFERVGKSMKQLHSIMRTLH